MRAVLGAMVGLAAAMASSAHAAQFGISRSGAMPVILVAGDFTYGDGERFARIAATLPRATVAFDSAGGNLLAGLKIGETMRARGYSSLVPDGSVCASACAIAWLGGAKRYLGSTGRLGFHAASGENGVSAPGNALVGAYMARLGLSQDAVFALTAASPYEIAWLDVAGAKQLGIAVERYAGPSFAAAAPSYAARRAGPVAVTSGRSAPRPVYARPAPRYADDDDPEGPTRHGSDCRSTGGHSGGC
jgi:hypothetical protein